MSRDRYEAPISIIDIRHFEYGELKFMFDTLLKDKEHGYPVEACVYSDSVVYRLMPDLHVQSASEQKISTTDP